MRIVTIVGIKGSGKTTVTEALTAELTRRGRRVGTVKSVFCPAFHMDKPGSNTDRHLQAGAAVVTARADTETDVIYASALKPSELLRHYTACDWVLCEGDYELPVPRVVTAHAEKDACERLNPLTLAVSGRIANTDTAEAGGLPVLHPGRDIARLADLLEARVPEVTDLDGLDASLHGEDIALSQAFCGRGCGGHSHPQRGVRLTVDGMPVPLDVEQEKALRAWLAQNLKA